MPRLGRWRMVSTIGKETEEYEKVVTHDDKPDELGWPTDDRPKSMARTHRCQIMLFLLVMYLVGCDVYDRWHSQIVVLSANLTAAPAAAAPKAPGPKAPAPFLANFPATSKPGLCLIRKMVLDEGQQVPGPELPKGVVRYPGLALDPPVKLQHVKIHFQKTCGRKPPEDYWFLDAPTILKVIERSGNPLTKWAVNLGAAPQPFNNVEQDENGKVIESGDDVTSLYRNGYSGLNFDLEFNRVKVTKFYKELGPQQHVAFNIFPPTVVKAMQENGVPREPDFLKVDVDSFECDFISHILNGGYRPLVISAEVNPVPVPPLLYSTSYAKNSIQYHDMVGNMLGSCSLQFMHNLIQPFGYTLIQFPLEDGWWVQSKYAHLFGNVPHDPRDVFRIGNPYMYGRYPDKMKQWFLNPSGTALLELDHIVQCVIEGEGKAKHFKGKRFPHIVMGM